MEQLEGTVHFPALIGEELPPAVPESKAKAKASASKPAFVASGNGKPKRSHKKRVPPIAPEPARSGGEPG